MEEVRLEREHLQAQLQSTHQQLENIRADMQVGERCLSLFISFFFTDLYVDTEVAYREQSSPFMG